ncbi:MAG: translocation/assembly module TamB domain-containing protein [Candidatus Omnitrophica bacterium]|nr:translocation/assembly module TamB domain-containing protein [Candidatus Omnitrophota bacterium]
MCKNGFCCLVILITIVLIAVGALFYYFLFTTDGSSLILCKGVSEYIECDDIEIKNITGNLSSALTLNDIELKDLEGLPPGSYLKLQKLEIDAKSFNLAGLNVKIDNGRLKLPDSNPILFYGRYSNSSLDVNAYCNQVYVREFLDLFAETSILKSLSGKIIGLDVYVKGSLFEPELQGEFVVEELIKNGFSMANCPVTFKVTLKDLKAGLKVFGEMQAKSGIIKGPKTAAVELQESKIVFSGNPKAPKLALNGSANVEGTKINISLRGSIDKPDLELKSEPAWSEERLLLMLATGKSWKNTETVLGKGEISTELARDFVDYFFFGGSGTKIAKSFGVDDVAFKYDSKTKGIELKKSISDKLEATYGLEQSQKTDSETSTTQKVGGGYKVTDSISVGAERELRIDTTGEAEKAQTNDKLMLKYKKQF